MRSLPANTAEGAAILPGNYLVTNPNYAGGAKGDDSTNDTAAIQAAINACGAAGGGTVYFPPGKYRYSGLTINQYAVTLKGSGIGVTYLRNTSETGNGIMFSNGNAGIAFGGVTNLSFQPAVTKTAGYELFCQGINKHNFIQLWFQDVYGAIKIIGGMEDGTGNISPWNTFDNIQFYNYHRMLWVQDCIDTTFSNWYVWNTHASDVIGLTVDGKTEGCYFDKIDIINSNQTGQQDENTRCLVIQHTVTDRPPKYCKFTSCLFDTHGYGIYATAGYYMDFTDTWMATGIRDGAYVGGTANGFKFINPTIVRKDRHGINFVAGKSHHVIGGNIHHNAGNGIVIGAATRGVTVMGVSLGNPAFDPGVNDRTQTGGILIEAGADNYLIKANTFDNQANPIVGHVSNTATRIVEDNITTAAV